MKLPWDRRYLKIAFHAVVAVAAAYALILAVNFAAFALASPGHIGASVSGGFKKLCGLFSPFIVAAVLAYVLNPMADFFQKWNDCIFKRLVLKYVRKDIPAKRKKPAPKYKKRTAGAALSYLAIVLAILPAALALASRFGGVARGGRAAEMLGAIMTTLDGLEETLARVEVKLMEWGAAHFFSKYITDFTSALGQLRKAAADAVAATMANAGSWMTSLGLGVVIAFYLLRDKDAVLRGLSDGLTLVLPDKANARVRRFLSRLHRVFSGYIHGVLIDACVVSALIAAWLMIVRVDFAIAIGLITGFSNIVPYVGAVIGLALAVLAALISGGPARALLAAVGVLLIQLADGMFIQPKVVGVSVRLSPALVLASLYVFGKLFGIVGMALAVPLCAVVKMMLEDILRKNADA